MFAFHVSGWSKVSGTVFLIFFLLLIIQIYRPAMKKRYENASKLPLTDEDSGV